MENARCFRNFPKVPVYMNLYIYVYCGKYTQSLPKIIYITIFTRIRTSQKDLFCADMNYAKNKIKYIFIKYLVEPFLTRIYISYFLIQSRLFPIPFSYSLSSLFFFSCCLLLLYAD